MLPSSLEQLGAEIPQISFPSYKILQAQEEGLDASNQEQRFLVTLTQHMGKTRPPPVEMICIGYSGVQEKE